MKVMTIVGARPQFIKASVVSRALQSMGVHELLLHTGQHFDANMSEVFFTELEIPHPAVNLDIHGGTHGAMTGRMLEGIEAHLMAERPDWVLVYGDTNSTLAGALAAAKLNIPVAHVEAGLRSFNRRMPEEINRILTDHASSQLFAPTRVAVSQLQTEGIPIERVHLVGDVMYDASLYFGEKAESKSQILRDLGLDPRGYLLATIHRQENTDDLGRFAAIVSAFTELAANHTVVWPVHPRTKGLLQQHNLLRDIPANLKLIDPVGYLDMAMLEKNALVIATDSGGVQKEAFFYQVPCVTLRDETEWTELVQSGWNRLASPCNRKELVSAIENSIGKVGQAIQPYGDGQAASKIAQVLARVST